MDPLSNFKPAGSDGAETHAPSPPTSAPRFDLPLAATLAVWAALSALLFLYVTLFGQNVPYHDDVEFVEDLSGRNPITAEWFWRLHNEHRFPLARALMLGSCHLFGYDLRPILFLSAAFLSAASLLLLVTIARLRGRAGWGDIVVPLYGLSLMHYHNVSEAQGLSFCLYLFLFAVLLAAILQKAWESLPGSLLLGTGVLLLSMSGGYGLAGSLVAIPALIVLASVMARRGGPAARTRAAVIGVLALLASVQAASYLLAVPENRATEAPVEPTPFSLTFNFLRAVAMAWGGRLPPWLHPGDTWFSLLPLGALVLAFLALAAWHVRNSPGDRRRSWALLLSLLAVLAVAAVVSYGRSNMRWFGSWYATMFTPLPWTMYLVATLDRRAVTRGLAAALLLVLGACAWFESTADAWRYGVRRRTATEKLVHDALTGIHPADLASMHLIDRWSMMDRKAEIFEYMAGQQIGPFDPSRPWLLEDPRFPEGRAWKLGRIDPHAWAPPSPGGPSVSPESEVLLLRVPSGGASFSMVPAPANLLEAGLIRITLFSPAETLARFQTAENAVATAPVRVGVNALTFLLPDPASGFVPRFSPGEVRGIYRILSIWSYPFPVPVSAFPEPLSAPAANGAP